MTLIQYVVSNPVHIFASGTIKLKLNRGVKYLANFLLAKFWIHVNFLGILSS